MENSCIVPQANTPPGTIVTWVISHAFPGSYSPKSIVKFLVISLGSGLVNLH